MRHTTGLIILFSSFLGFVLIAAPQAVDEVIEVSLNLTGRLEAKRRTSDNYPMTVENWTMDSDYAQTTDYTLVREPSGRVGGVPTFFFGVMEERNMLFEPTLSPFDAIKFNLTGSIKVTGCVSLLDPLSARNESGFKPGVNPPPGIPRGVATPGRMGCIKQVFFRIAC